MKYRTTKCAVRLHTGESQQRGISTLTVTLIIVLLTGLAMAYTSRNAFNEQRLSGNEVREKQAFDAANAGIEQAIAYMANQGIDKSPKDGAADLLVPAALASNSAYQVIYCPARDDLVNLNDLLNNLSCGATRNTAISCGGLTWPAAGSRDFRNVFAFSCGWSDDDTAVKKITQRFRNAPSLAGTIETPLISKGAVNMATANVSVMNHENDLTIWTGEDIDRNNATRKTYINDRTGTKPDMTELRTTGAKPCNQASTQGFMCSTVDDVIGHDTITGDTRLSSLTAPEFFKAFFGTPKETYKKSIVQEIIPAANVASLEGKTGTSIWVEGSVQIDKVIGGEGKDAVILIIDGNLDLKSGALINGIVFVTGDLTVSGNPLVFGSLIVTGSTDIGAGTMTIVYDGSSVKGPSDTGKAAKVQGSWRDW